MPPRTTRPVAAVSPRLLRAGVVRAVCIIFLLAAAALRVGAAVSAQQFAAGDTATVAAEGDGLLLRDGPGYDASVLDLYPDGTLVAIVEGPITAGDGSVWFAVEVEGQAGYMVADWLASPETAPQPAPAPAPEPASATDQAPAAAGYCDGAQEYID